MKIYNAIQPRLEELCKKLIDGNSNMATRFVYEIGFVTDIDYVLSELKIKRTIVKQKNVQEIEFKDIEKMLNMLGKNKKQKKVNYENDKS